MYTHSAAADPAMIASTWTSRGKGMSARCASNWACLASIGRWACTMEDAAIFSMKERISFACELIMRNLLFFVSLPAPNHAVRSLGEGILVSQQTTRQVCHGCRHRPGLIGRHEGRRVRQICKSRQPSEQG